LWSCHCHCCRYSEVCIGGEGFHICWGMVSCKSCTARKCTVSWWLVTLAVMLVAPLSSVSVRLLWLRAPS
jgi:hypothetical protein